MCPKCKVRAVVILIYYLECLRIVGKKQHFPGNEQKRACLVYEMVVGDVVLIPAVEEVALASDLVSFFQ